MNAQQITTEADDLNPSMIHLVRDGEPAGTRTDEQRIARAVQLAMPGLDFHTNTTSVSAIRVYANKLEGEQRDGEDALARNDDIAEAIRLAGFYVARRGVGQAVYASVADSPYPADPMCAVESHEGEPAPWIAVLTAPNVFDAPYACRACVRRRVESERVIESNGLPENPQTAESPSVGDRVVLPEGHVPDDWSRRGEVIDLDDQVATVELNDEHRQDVVLDELEPEQQATGEGEYHPTGRRYRQKEGLRERIVEVDSVLTTDQTSTVEFTNVAGIDKGIVMSMPLEDFLNHFEPADAPRETDVAALAPVIASLR